MDFPQGAPTLVSSRYAIVCAKSHAVILSIKVSGDSGRLGHRVPESNSQGGIITEKGGMFTGIRVESYVL